MWPSNIIGTIIRAKNAFALQPKPTGSRYSASVMQIFAAAVAMAVEIASIRLTMIGLRLAKEQATAIATAAIPTSQTTRESVAATAAASHSSEFLECHVFDSEIQRRKVALLFYLLRAPLFNRTTLPLLEMASRMLDRIPIIGSLPSTAIGLLKYLHRTHFYTSSSS